MTTKISFINTEKRKLDAFTGDESQQGGPIQKLLKRTSTEQLSNIYSQDRFTFETQNRAAQRAFRERKERHLRELENTIKTLRENQYDSALKVQRELTHYRSLIEQLESENYYLKEIAFTFECALNKINGNNDATTKIKNALSLNIPARSSAPSQPLTGVSGIIGHITSPFGFGALQMRHAGLQSRQVPTVQQLQNNFLDLFQVPVSSNGRDAHLGVSSPVSSNVMMSPNGSSTISTKSVSIASSPLTPESIAESISPSSTFFAEEFAREMTLADMKPFVNPTPGIQISHEPSFVGSYPFNSSIASFYKSAISSSSQVMSKSNSTVSTGSTESSNDDTANTNKNNSSGPTSPFMDGTVYNFADVFSAYLNDNDLEEFPGVEFNNSDVSPSSEQQQDTTKRLSKEEDQIIRLSKKVGQTYPQPVMPKIRHPLTEQQIQYLTIDHDRRIDMIPCLHLRSRMIQYKDEYDLYELCELLINKAICHGEPLDPDSWELPDEFFERYDVLVFQHCRIKSSLYKKFGHLPADFESFYGKGESLDNSLIFD
ncbi:7250_t:CDS:2 [Funneliformis geosporum]|uniref:2279_t:CDS:1 n=1 Tax=Funneliformis geosporum TaxID=1117311 RepID=A0A9W4WUF0_9GLOM|nr:7250_t:CDS:2 [Funneliformis geosporum]CAI2172922.1 2279_t:CDS:2 [Funneliformis geosporum]